MRNVAIAFCLCALAAGCASTSGGGGKPPATTETFAYHAASDDQVAVAVENVVITGSPDFIPTDPNWIQVRLVVENKGAAPITISQLQVKLADGTVIRPGNPGEIFDRPSYLGSQASFLGVHAASAAATMFVPIPFLGPAIGLGSHLLGASKADQMAKRVERAQRESFAVAQIHPGTKAAGNVYLPAVANQAGILVVYSGPSGAKSITVDRQAPASTQVASQ